MILTTVTFLSPHPEDDSAGMVIRLSEDSSRSAASAGKLSRANHPLWLAKGYGAIR